MPKSNIKAFIRTRPTALTSDGFKVHQDGCSVTIKLPKEADAGLINNKQEDYSFKFDGVLENVSQETLYNTAASEVVDSVLQGYSGCVFAYGQTGAGKTFTMSGDLRHYAHRGVIPRAVHHLFKEIDMRVDKLYEVQVSYLEIYNEQLYDLLAENPGSSEGLAVMEDAHHGTYVRGLTRVPVRSEEETLAQFFVGEQGRSKAQHVLNTSSSRSHCVFTLHVSIRNSEAAGERALLARLHMVDLAGSERTKKTNATGQTLKEAQFINKSLSFLEQTVNALARHDSHVPFRQTRLTSVLKDALGGNCKTVMVANIWGETAHLEETLSTLRFAARIRTLTTELALSESSDAKLLVKRYERQIKELKQELAMRDALSGRTRVNYDDLNDADIREMQRLAKAYLQGEADLEELPCDSLRRIRETYKQLKSVAVAAQEEAQLSVSQARAEAAAAAAQAAAGSAPGSAGGRVGDVDKDMKGFQLGVAPPDLKPSKSVQLSAGIPGTAGSQAPNSIGRAGSLSRNQTAYSQSQAGGPGDGDLGGTLNVPGGPERSAAFSRFKHDVHEGRALYDMVHERQAQLKGIKISIKEVTASVNAAKASIDSIAERLAASPAQQDSEVISAEHYSLVQELKTAKATYRQEFDKLKELRSCLEPLASSVAEAKQDLVNEFDKWMTINGADAMAHNDSEDELDPGEAFERMQLGSVTAKDPDSLAYHAAMRKSAGASPRQFGGSKAAANATRKKEYTAMINSGLGKGYA